MSFMKQIGLLFLGLIGATVVCLVAIPFVWIVGALLPIAILIGLPLGALSFYATKRIEAWKRADREVLFLEEIQRAVWPIRNLQRGRKWRDRLILQGELFGIGPVEMDQPSARAVGDASINPVPRATYLYEELD